MIWDNGNDLMRMGIKDFGGIPSVSCSDYFFNAKVGVV